MQQQTMFQSKWSTTTPTLPIALEKLRSREQRQKSVIRGNVAIVQQVARCPNVGPSEVYIYARGGRVCYSCDLTSGHGLLQSCSD